MTGVESRCVKDVLLNYDGTQKEPEHFKDYLIHIITDSHPLDKILDVGNWTLPCLLLTKYEQHSKSEELMTSTTDESMIGVETLCESFAGSPLKLQEFATESFLNNSTCYNSPSKVVDTLKPITADEARSLLTEYTLSWQSKEIAKQKRDSFPPFWVFCDGKDPEHNVMLGAHIARQNKYTHYLVANVTTQGPLLEHSKEMCKIWKLRPAYFTSGKVHSSKCSAKYRLSGPKMCDIDLSWKKSTRLMETPPPDAKPVVTATVVAGDEHSPVYPMYTELSRLQHLLQAVENGDMEWSGSQDGMSLMAKVKSLIKEKCLELVEDHSEGDATLANDTMLLKKPEFVLKRRQLDFTEKLWLILKDCQQYEDLVSCLQHIFHCLVTEEVHYVISKGNDTLLANLIHEAYQGNVSLPQLEGKLPLELVLQMGINKLYNDYLQVFQEQDAADLLQPFDDDTVSERIVTLEKIHHATELLTLLESLDFEKTVLHTAAKLAFDYYAANPVSNGHKFTIPMPMSSVWPALAKLQLSTWKVVLSVTKNNSLVRSVYLITEENPFDHTDNTLSDADLSKSKTYYVTNLTEDIIVL